MDRRKEAWRPVLIAMKGHPGTGKSTLAKALAKAIKCPLVDKDHFRDCTYPIQQALLQTSPAMAAKLLNDLSYEAMRRVAAAQLGLGLSVVVDSPLSRQAHLNCLMEMAARSGARVVVVECKPGDEGEWRRRVEVRGADCGGMGWHKPATWEDMQRLLEEYGGCWEFDVGDVPKLVVDTTGGVEVEEMVSKVIEFVDSCNLDQESRDK
ncbi:uncharacterized protein LOC127251827 [Andrographis paniculata]|uniref:uncharacterized protein LOC127251827 n=1 Tax=Andrographis paniculata TaxID=175694 RepID=UPI0021E8BBEB|nr:uncharacterized protein LOC127251827 [Andrographis paniculata]XP_051131677.1 uncharacterized protein LOC127251827 [Andrographis paniculata]XP_051131678.1 uncharacterized protein LOC127251827 [Andrographis paniculata]XP_051131679.1 uncharacterized protein LOC127251827 [Andrographis paniculata]XP_051131680.1 uncharacterized protein LOC127251827 [Andrographis paniculata]XP_051131681.1 uncharacterized protein LOC127251827 [Andrographis paniculata]